MAIVVVVDSSLVMVTMVMVLLSEVCNGCTSLRVVSDGIMRIIGSSTIVNVLTVHFAIDTGLLLTKASYCYYRRVVVEVTYVVRVVGSTSKLSLLPLWWTVKVCDDGCL